MGFEKFGLISYVSQTKVSKFTEYLEQGKIYGTKCLKCGFMEFPPRAYCGRCLSDKWEWTPLSGNCKLLTFTRVEAAPAAFKTEVPYLLGLAEFTEGPKVLAWIEHGIPESSVRAGAEFKLRPAKLQNGQVSYLLTSRDKT